MNTTYASRNAANLCLKCGAPRDNHTKMCCVCRDAEKERNEGVSKRRRDKLLAAGLCTMCGGHRGASTTQTCEVCSGKERDRMRPIASLRVERYRAAGLCISCGKAPGSPRCKKCTAANLAAQRRLRETNAEQSEANGFCWKCEGVWDPAANKCTACGNTKSYHEAQYLRETYGGRKMAGHCVTCGIEWIGVSVNCPTCRRETANRQYASRTHKKISMPGVCKTCHLPVYGQTTKCERHWVYSLIHNYTRASVPEKLLQTMIKKLRDSKLICAYTGMPIVPGDTASIEHIYSRKLYPHLEADPRNMVWVHSMANWLKQETDPRDSAMLRMLSPDIAARITALASALDPTVPSPASSPQ